jgi:hypothetical protein
LSGFEPGISLKSAAISAINTQRKLELESFFFKLLTKIGGRKKEVAHCNQTSAFIFCIGSILTSRKGPLQLYIDSEAL